MDVHPFRCRSTPGSPPTPASSIPRYNPTPLPHPALPPPSPPDPTERGQTTKNQRHPKHARPTQANTCSQPSLGEAIVLLHGGSFAGALLSTTDSLPRARSPSRDTAHSRFRRGTPRSAGPSQARRRAQPLLSHLLVFYAPSMQNTRTQPHARGGMYWHGRNRRGTSRSAWATGPAMCHHCRTHTKSRFTSDAMR